MASWDLRRGKQQQSTETQEPLNVLTLVQSVVTLLAAPMIEGLRVVCRQLQPEAAERGARLAARVQDLRRLLPKAAQDGVARRRARGAVLPAVPPRVPKDHGVARGAGVSGGALDVRKPGPAAIRGLCYGVA